MADLVALKQFESEQERKVRYVQPPYAYDGCTDADVVIRERLLSNIAQLVTKFVHDVSIRAGLSEKVASEAGGRIYTSGSYRSVASLSSLLSNYNRYTSTLSLCPFPSGPGPRLIWDVSDTG